MQWTDNAKAVNVSVGKAVPALPSGRAVLPTRFSDMPSNRIQARYDSAQTTSENRRHWRLADSFSADAAANPQVRKIIRERARYEIANNTYAKGLILTVASDVVGTCPRIQLLNAPSTRWENKIETLFTEWMEETCLAERLATMTQAKLGDGETFGLLVNNPKLVGDVKFELVPIECERVCSSNNMISRPDCIDGVIIDSIGNPIAYEYLEEHPGDIYNRTFVNTWKKVDARWMVHWFRKDRPEQHRGVSEISSALPLFAQLRRYTLATLAAAETAADYAAILYTDNPAAQTAVEGVPFDMVDINKRMMTVLPDGWKMGQFSPEQPVTTYSEFKREILGEIARCLQVPINVISGDSSQHNYASGRLDHQTYHRAIRVTQASMSRTILNKLFVEWLKEFSLANGYSSNKFADCRATWMFDGFEHVDPKKEADAQAIRIANMTTSYATEYAKQGRDWEIEFKQIAKEQEMIKSLGIAVVEPKVSKGDDDE
jgi:lambda family phage portal protein